MTLLCSALMLDAAPSLHELMLHISISIKYSAPWTSSASRLFSTSVPVSLRGHALDNDSVREDLSLDHNTLHADALPSRDRGHVAGVPQWLYGPASDGCSPSCAAPSLDILTLGHPGQTHLVPPAAPPTRLPSPLPSPTSTSSTLYAAYPSTPADLPTSPSSLFSADLFSSLSSEEEEDATDYSLPVLAHAHALQMCRHTPHPFSSVLGLCGALGIYLDIIRDWLLAYEVIEDCRLRSDPGSTERIANREEEEREVQMQTKGRRAK
ncbi:hypothetical protein B0H14DRAFT_2644596 [Mycena olivaceomarginata]|nr:hypothetical protein B0H14DRAFT_2644596 [Mycena olivaceomarginata]